MIDCCSTVLVSCLLFGFAWWCVPDSCGWFIVLSCSELVWWLFYVCCLLYCNLIVHFLAWSLVLLFTITFLGFICVVLCVGFRLVDWFGFICWLVCLLGYLRWMFAKMLVLVSCVDLCWGVLLVICLSFGLLVFSTVVCFIAYWCLACWYNWIDLLWVSCLLWVGCWLGC